MLIDLIDINLIFEESMRLAYGTSFAAKRYHTQTGQHLKPGPFERGATIIPSPALPRF